MTRNEIDIWMNYKGKKFLKDIGLNKNQTILDFGCGVGIYTIPASLIVGDLGRVYAVDKNPKILKELKLEIEKRRLKNIELIELKNHHMLPFDQSSIDMILMYDVLHLVENRKALLKGLYDILKTDGIISVYPKHHEKYMNLDLNGVRQEIESIGFIFNKKISKTVMHNKQLEKGYILNFGII